MIHLGSRIKEVFHSMPDRPSIEWLARRLCCNRANVYNIFSRESIDVELLRRISHTLDHDFFAELSEDFRAEEAQLRRGTALPDPLPLPKQK